MYEGCDWKIFKTGLLGGFLMPKQILMLVFILLAYTFVSRSAFAQEFTEFTFGGPDGYLFVNPTTAYGQTPITVEMWARIDNIDTWNVLIARGAKGPGHWEIDIRPNDNTEDSGIVSVYLPDVASVNAPGSFVADGEWHLIAWSWDGDTANIAVDGAMYFSAMMAGSLSKPENAFPLAIGRLAEGGLGCSGGFSEVRISDIVRDLTAEPSHLTVDEHTISLWRAQDRNGNVIPDLGYAKRNAQVGGEINWGSAGIDPPNAILSIGMVNYSRRLWLPENMMDTLAPFTIEVWMSAATQDFYQILVAHGPKFEDSQSSHWELYLSPSGMLERYAPNMDPPAIGTGIVLAGTGWHAIGWSFDGTTEKIFIDGNKVYEAPASGFFFDGSFPMPLSIGALDDGSIPVKNSGFGELRISNIARDLTDRLPPYEVDTNTVGFWSAANYNSETKSIFNAVKTEDRVAEIFDTDDGGDPGISLGDPTLAFFSELTDKYTVKTLSVEAWVRVTDGNNYNIIAASAPKGPGHWELMTLPGSGVPALYIPDLLDGIMQARTNIADGSWHLVSFCINGAEVEIGVDGVLESYAAYTGSIDTTSPSQIFAVGCLVDETLQCNAALRALRISHAVHFSENQRTPLTLQSDTVSLWTSETLNENMLPDQGSAGVTLRRKDSTPTNRADHWVYFN